MKCRENFWALFKKNDTKLRIQNQVHKWIFIQNENRNDKKTTNLKKADKYHKHHEMQRKFLGPSLRKMIQNYEYKIRYISGYLFKREQKSQKNYKFKKPTNTTNITKCRENFLGPFSEK